MILLYLSSILCSNEFSGKLEVGTIYNEWRENGGSDISISDCYWNLRISSEYGWLNGDVDWVPSQMVLDYRSRPNYSNGSWLRGDGYASRPSLLLSLCARYGQFRARVGAFKFSGIFELRTPTEYYLFKQPPPLMHATHYDKGIEIGYSNSFVDISASILDGDWCMGESSVLTNLNSSSNSYPSYAANININKDRFIAGLSGTYGDMGSNPGDKRREDSVIGYLGYRGAFTLRPFVVGIFRNLSGNGFGRHDRSVDTIGYGIEGEWKGLYGCIWNMENKTGLVDNEVWIDSLDMFGWSVGYKRTVIEPLTVGIQYSNTGGMNLFGVNVAVTF